MSFTVIATYCLSVDPAANSTSVFSSSTEVGTPVSAFTVIVVVDVLPVATARAVIVTVPDFLNLTISNLLSVTTLISATANISSSLENNLTSEPRSACFNL